MAPTEFYAVGISKGWVEIRSSLTPPKPKKSSAEKEIEEDLRKVEFYFDGNHRYRHRYLTDKSKRQLKIQACTFSGGRAIRSYHQGWFYAKTHLMVGFGQVYKLTPKLVAKLRLKP